jgi:4-diphosphocytidyl-2-C-methyl-D-erythritol kinase
MARALSAARIWPAPAKLNLFLHVLGRRDDGYHTLQTVFQLLDVGDRLTFEVRTDGAIARVNAVAGVAPETDLCVRAARLLKPFAAPSAGVAIQLDKRLPIGGGVGGGSSNAATTLLALNALWRTGLSRDRLVGLSRSLGADVPVFVHGQSAFAEGVGDQLTAVELPERHFWVVTPPQAVPTAAVFSAPELTRHSAPLTIAGWLKGAATRNDCWDVVRQRFPVIAEHARQMERYGTPRLSGTGSSLFIEFTTRAQALRAATSAGLPGFVARGVNRSAVLDQLDPE